jgi:hypothetical protein
MGMTKTNWSSAIQEDKTASLVPIFTPRKLFMMLTPASDIPRCSIQNLDVDVPDDRLTVCAKRLDFDMNLWKMDGLQLPLLLDRYLCLPMHMRIPEQTVWSYQETWEYYRVFLAWKVPGGTHTRLCPDAWVAITSSIQTIEPLVSFQKSATSHTIVCF